MRIERVKYDESLFSDIIPREVRDTVGEAPKVLFGLFDKDNCIGISFFKLLKPERIAQLVYLYIPEKYRYNGYGSMLLNDTCKKVIEMGNNGVLINYVGSELEVDRYSEFWLNNSFYQIVDTTAQFIYNFENLKYEKLFDYHKDILKNRFSKISINDIHELKYLARNNSCIDLYSILDFDIDYNLTEFYEENGKFVGGILVSRKGSVVKVIDMFFNDISDIKRLMVFVGGIRKIYEKCLKEYHDISNFVICSIPLNTVKSARKYLGYPHIEYYCKEFYMTSEAAMDYWEVGEEDE